MVNRTVQLDPDPQITYLAKCDSTHCARRHPAARVFWSPSRSGLRVAPSDRFAYCHRQPPDTPAPLAPRPDYHRKTRSQNCICGRGGRAPCRSNGNDRCRATARISSCRSHKHRAVAPRWRGIPPGKLRIGAATGVAAAREPRPCGLRYRRDCRQAFVVDSQGLRHIAFFSFRFEGTCLPFRKLRRGSRHPRRCAKAFRLTRGRSAMRHAGRRVICRGAKGAKRSGFARRRSSRRCRKMRMATPVWRAARENQKPARRVAGGRSRSNRISPNYSIPVRVSSGVRDQHRVRRRFTYESRSKMPNSITIPQCSRARMKAPAAAIARRPSSNWAAHRCQA